MQIFQWKKDQTWRHFVYVSVYADYVQLPTMCKLENAEDRDYTCEHSTIAFQNVTFVDELKSPCFGEVRAWGLNDVVSRNHIHIATAFSPRRPISTRLSGDPSTCCRCWGTGWCRASWCGRHTSWFPPSWAASPVTVNPSRWQAAGVNKRALCGDARLSKRGLRAEPRSSHRTLLYRAGAELASSFGASKLWKHR